MDRVRGEMGPDWGICMTFRGVRESLIEPLRSSSMDDGGLTLGLRRDEVDRCTGAAAPLASSVVFSRFLRDPLGEVVLSPVKSEVVEPERPKVVVVLLTPVSVRYVRSPKLSVERNESMERG